MTCKHGDQYCQKIGCDCYAVKGQSGRPIARGKGQDRSRGQADLDLHFGNECEGMCGL